MSSRVEVAMSSDAYRSGRAALEDRASQLRSRIAELSTLDGEKNQAARELSGIEKRLVDLHKRTLPMLERVTVASPCSASWQDMKGDDRVRFCGLCSKNVFNLSAMSREEAMAFVFSVEQGAACVRFYKRSDGTMLTADCPVGVRRRRQRRIIGMAVGAAALGLGTAAFATLHRESCEKNECTTRDQRSRTSEGWFGKEHVHAPALMGSMAAIQPPPPVTRSK